MKFRMYPQLPASDLARAQAWYSETLGVEPTEPGDELFYDTGTAQFGIYQSDNAGTNRATAVRLVVEDFDAVRADLHNRALEELNGEPLEGHLARRRQAERARPPRGSTR